MSHTLLCANCGIVIRWQPTVVDGQVYCCLGCSRGGPCTCDYSNLPQEGDSTAMVLVGKGTLQRMEIEIMEVSENAEDRRN